jgi:hypothetical protein
MIVSERGEFGSLQELRCAYLKSRDGGKFWLDPTPFGVDGWEKKLLHISDVAGCPRAAMYRLAEYPEKRRSTMSAANREIMFWAGYRFHYLTYSALDWADLLVAHERPLEVPEGWSGQLDALFVADYRKGLEDLVLYDMKTELPNAIKYAWDKPKYGHVLQIALYRHFLREERTLDPQRTVVEYADRAGANAPLLCWLDDERLKRAAREGLERMRFLEECRDALPDLPDTLKPELSPSYWKARGEPWRYVKTVSYGPSWLCGYCEYHQTEQDGRTSYDSLCHPFNEPKAVVAEYHQNGHAKSICQGFEQRVGDYLAGLPRTIPIVDEDEE